MCWAWAESTALELGQTLPAVLSPQCFSVISPPPRHPTCVAATNPSPCLLCERTESAERRVWTGVQVWACMRTPPHPSSSCWSGRRRAHLTAHCNAAVVQKAPAAAGYIQCVEQYAGPLYMCLSRREWQSCVLARMQSACSTLGSAVCVPVVSLVFGCNMQVALVMPGCLHASWHACHMACDSRCPKFGASAAHSTLGSAVCGLAVGAGGSAFTVPTLRTAHDEVLSVLVMTPLVCVCVCVRHSCPGSKGWC